MKRFIDRSVAAYFVFAHPVYCIDQHCLSVYLCTS